METFDKRFFLPEQRTQTYLGEVLLESSVSAGEDRKTTLQCDGRLLRRLLLLISV